MSVSREEIVGVVGDAFGSGALTRSEILAAAAERRVRPEVIETLETIPERPYRQVRDLWDELPDVPVEVEAEQHQLGRPAQRTAL